MKHLYEKLEDILGDDLPMFLSDDRNLDLVKEVYSFGFEKGAEVARKAAKDIIDEYISTMKEKRNDSKRTDY